MRAPLSAEHQQDRGDAMARLAAGAVAMVTAPASAPKRN